MDVGVQLEVVLLPEELLTDLAPEPAPTAVGGQVTPQVAFTREDLEEDLGRSAQGPLPQFPPPSFGTLVSSFLETLSYLSMAAGGQSVSPNPPDTHSLSTCEPSPSQSKHPPCYHPGCSSKGLFWGSINSYSSFKTQVRCQCLCEDFFTAW